LEDRIGEINLQSNALNVLDDKLMELTSYLVAAHQSSTALTEVDVELV
jgi:hypothetical protein